jgi:hypothetical protein
MKHSKAECAYTGEVETGQLLEYWSSKPGCATQTLSLSLINIFLWDWASHFAKQVL